MPLSVACPGCQSKLKVPDEAAGKKAKCPKCGGVIVIPSATAVAAPPPPPPEELEPLGDDLDFNAPTPAKKAKPAKRRDDDSADDIPAPKAKAAGKPKRRDDADDDYNPDGFRADDGSRLHAGWKKVALGYHLLGFAVLVSGMALVAGVGLFAALGGIPKVQAVFEAFNAPAFDKSETVRIAKENTLKEVMASSLIAGLVGGGLLTVASILALIGQILLILMPKDEEGGKGKTLGILNLVAFVVGFVPLNMVLLPLYTMGIGAKLDKPKVKKAGIGLFIWFAVALILIPAAAFGGFFGMMQLAPPDANGKLQATMFALIVATGLTVGAAVISLLGIGGCFTAARRGILASVRDRGIIDGEDPQPKEEKKAKGKGKKGDDEDDDDRPKKRQSKEDSDDRPKKAKAKRDDDSSADHRPLKAKAKPADDDADDAPPPKPKRRRDEDDEDDRPRRRK